MHLSLISIIMYFSEVTASPLSAMGEEEAEEIEDEEEEERRREQEEGGEGEYEDNKDCIIKHHENTEHHDIDVGTL